MQITKRLIYLTVGLAMMTGIMLWLTLGNLVKLINLTVVRGENPVGVLYVPELDQAVADATDPVDAPLVPAEASKRHYERRMVVNHFQQGSVRV